MFLPNSNYYISLQTIRKMLTLNMAKCLLYKYNTIQLYAIKVLNHCLTTEIARLHVYEACYTVGKILDLWTKAFSIAYMGKLSNHTILAFSISHILFLPPGKLVETLYAVQLHSRAHAHEVSHLCSVRSYR